MACVSRSIRLSAPAPALIARISARYGVVTGGPRQCSRVIPLSVGSSIVRGRCFSQTSNWRSATGPKPIRGASKLFKYADDAVADIKSGSVLLSSGFGLCGVAGKKSLEK